MINRDKPYIYPDPDSIIDWIINYNFIIDEKEINSPSITGNEKIEAIYSITGPRKILMLRKLINKEAIYTPYGVQYLKLNVNKLPTYYQAVYLTDIQRKEEFVEISYQKGRSEEINRLIGEKLES